MRKILLLGAGRSSSALIKYFLDNSAREEWTLTVADHSIDHVKSKINNHPNAKAVSFDSEDANARKALVSDASIVISLLPANMHFPIALECVRQKKNLVTASYVSPEIQELNEEAIAAGIVLLNECGLDPGIDHMSAMEVLDSLKEQGVVMNAFLSYTGGLVAPESNDNPWGYKFSWNPRNVILAGQGTAKYIENGFFRYIPYNRLFSETRKISIDGLGDFDGYANRDSLSYRKIYNLDNIQTLIRGTLRQSGYCRAWNVFVQLGITDDTYKISGSENLSYKKFIESFLPSYSKGKNIEERLAAFAGIVPGSNEMKMISWTGILSDNKIGIPDATPAQILQHLLEDKWRLKNSDKDMIVMQHQFEYTLGGKKFFQTSSLAVKGDNSVDTAMAKTVGLPAAITAKLILNGKISLKGVQIPVHKSIYKPVLNELQQSGISFVEKQMELV